jgi:signal peptidase I
MLPTLLDGENRLRLPTTSRPERGEVVYFLEPDTGEAAVKRVVGLPGERIQLIDGDLYIDGTVNKRPVFSPEEMVPLIDASGEEIAKFFPVEENEFLPSGELKVSKQVTLREYPKNGFLLDGRLCPGPLFASDLGISVHFSFEKSGALSLNLREGAHQFYLKITENEASLHSGTTQLKAVQFSSPVKSGTLFFAKVDQQLTATLNQTLLMDPVSFDSKPNIPLVGVPSGPPPEHAGFSGQNSTISRIRIVRDRFRKADGTYASSSELQLAEDEYFLLGDNHSQSRDSRFYGPVRLEDFLGRIGPRLSRPSVANCD